METKQIVVSLCLLIASTLSHADFTINDGQYLIVSNGLLPNSFMLKVTDPQNNFLSVSAITTTTSASVDVVTVPVVILVA